MPQFSDKSKAKLATCHRDLITLFNYVILHFDCSILCGHRGKDEQDQVFERGASQLKYPASKHNKTPAMAVDVAPYPYDAKDERRILYFAGVVTGIAHLLYCEGAMSHRLRWGGDWDRDTEVKDNKFNDLFHYELIGV